MWRGQGRVGPWSAARLILSALSPCVLHAQQQEILKYSKDLMKERCFEARCCECSHVDDGSTFSSSTALETKAPTLQ